MAPEPGAEFIEGLVLDRPGEVTTPTVSGTHVTESQINEAEGTELVRLVYLLRQEALFLEGRRIHDLGMRFPIMLREVDANPTIDMGDFGTETVIPDYIPAPSTREINLFAPRGADLYEGGDGELLTDEIAMLHDMNRILAEERGLVIENPMLPSN